MKHYFALIATALLTISVCSFAQDKPEHRHGRKGIKPEVDKKEMVARNMERIKMEKKEFLTKKLELTEKESEAFWPIYEAYGEALTAAHKATNEARRNLFVKRDETVSDKEMQKRLDAYIEAQEAEAAIAPQYNKIFQTVLPVGKVARLYLAEEHFRKQITTRMTGHRPGPAPDHKEHKGKRPDRKEGKEGDCNDCTNCCDNQPQTAGQSSF